MVKYKINDKKFTGNYDNVINQINYDFSISKKRIQEVFTSCTSMKCRKKVQNTKLSFHKKLYSCYYEDQNKIYLSLYSVKNRRFVRKYMVHELLHACGVDHDYNGRKLGYKTKLRDDELTNKVMKLIGFKAPVMMDYDSSQGYLINNGGKV